MEIVRAGVWIQAWNIDVNRFEEAIEHFAGFFDWGVLAAKEQFDVGVCFERFRDVEFHDDGLLRKDGLGLLGKRLGIDGELMADEMDEARGMVRDGKLREPRTERVGKSDECGGDVRGGRFAKKEE